MGHTGFHWPAGQEAAISLSFDDGLVSQREVGAPLLERWGIQATFYVNPREDYRSALAAWQPVVAAGHEVGNHTVSHPCSKNFAFISENNRRALEEMTWEEMDWEIAEAKRRLAEALAQPEPVSFAYPCYQPFIGRGTDRKSYVPLVLIHCVAGRGRGERANDPRYCDLGYLWSWPCERLTGPHLIGLVEQAAAEGRWAILTFHGIHEGHLAVAESDLAELCAYLARHRTRIWTAPVATVARWVAEQQAGGAW
ncbi:MAG TPA: polysaccharide deacetylase family protein [Caldilineaceae bacterium]|nr:polysaccharide deacetylase family protein [Caldilineaceae bacterium]